MERVLCSRILFRCTIFSRYSKIKLQKEYFVFKVDFTYLYKIEQWFNFCADHRPHGRNTELPVIPRSESTSEFQPLEDKEVEYFFASDASAIIEHTNRVIFLEVRIDTLRQILDKITKNYLTRHVDRTTMWRPLKKAR